MTMWKKFKLADSDGYVLLSNKVVQEVKITTNTVCIITQCSNVYDVTDIDIQELEDWLNETATPESAPSEDENEIQFVTPDDIDPDPECTPDNPKYAEAFATLDCSDVLR